MTTDGRLLNIACDTYKGNVYLVAENTSTNEKTAIATEQISMSVMPGYFATSSGISKPFVTIKNKIGDGNYRLYLASKSDTEQDYSPVRTTDKMTNSYLMTVADGNITSLDAETDAAWMVGTTGINGITMDNAGGNLAPTYYSISGQRLSSPSSRNIVILKQGNNVRKVMTQ